MQLKQQINGSRAIVYDADRISEPGLSLFDPEFWIKSGNVDSVAAGRGNALMVQTPYGEAVLREYLRGGAVAKISRSRYVFTGFIRSRPFMEASVMAKLETLGLPVPGLLGGVCLKRGLTYSAALLTLRIPDAVPLADLLVDSSGTDPMWPAVGQCVRKFHQAGLYHADLNIRNVLVDCEGKVWLIDFDRARFLPAGSPQLKKNLNRLLRSLRKGWNQPTGSVDDCWSELLSGYGSLE
jgi:3-deoxy-D-manno-octulosonic acid kinase